MDDSTLRNVRTFWDAIGARNPYFGVLTDRRYAGTALEPAVEAEFFESGRGCADDLDRYLRDATGRGLAATVAGAAVAEIGVGVGRVASAVAPLCAEFVGVDIAPSYLAEFALRAPPSARGVLLDAWLAEETRYALVYSLITLQHNPPDVIARLVETACAKLAPGGAAILHIPYHADGYRFVDDARMQMNVLPEDRILAAARRAGCRLARRVETDLCGPAFANAVYVLIRPNSG